MELIEFDSQVANKRQAAFVIFFALDGKPWADYAQTDSARRKRTVPTCLMVNRSDGNIGFIGGMVEPGETLQAAARREVEEEIGHIATSVLESVVAHDIGDITTHAFMAQTTYGDLRTIQEKATSGAHFGSELTGVFLTHLIDYRSKTGKRSGLVNLLRSSMAPSVREEMIHFLLKTHIFDWQALAALCQQADYKLSKLAS